MDLETWHVLALATVVLVIYGSGILLGAPPSLVGLVVVAAFLVGGIVLGRAISERYLER